MTLLFATGAASGQSVGENDPEPMVSRGRMNTCAVARSIMLNFVVWSRDRQHFREVPIWQLPGSQAFFFVSGMTIDADGAPNAYGPDDTGLDDLANAGGPTHWDGIITDRDGNPLIQRESDPFPGYYISCTSLSDGRKKFTDPTRYVDAANIPYVVLPNDLADRGGARLGDFAVVMNLRNGKSSYAIYADIGTMGEGSIALADNLGIWSDARRGGEPDGILYLVFPGSGNLQPRTIDEIQSEAEKLLHNWGGIETLASCAANHNLAVTTATLKTALENSASRASACASNRFVAIPLHERNEPASSSRTTLPAGGAILGTSLPAAYDRSCRYLSPQTPLPNGAQVAPY
jgi:Fungal chitosanase of glycosyl hydrolase group 75